MLHEAARIIPRKPLSYYHGIKTLIRHEDMIRKILKGVLDFLRLILVLVVAVAVFSLGRSCAEQRDREPFSLRLWSAASSRL